MGAASIGIVEQVGVTGIEVAIDGHFINDGFYRERHGTDKDRQAARALNQCRASLRVIEAVAGVARFGNDRIERGSVQCCVHFVCDLLQTTVENGKRDGIKGAFHAASSFVLPLLLEEDWLCVSNCS